MTRWLLANRRYIGLSFAVSHVAHGLLIVELARRFPDVFWPHVDWTALVFGGFGYVVIAALTLTSNDYAVVRLGTHVWRRLHTAGIYYLWFIFVVTYGGPATSSSFHALMTLVFLGAWGLRLASRRMIGWTAVSGS